MKNKHNLDKICTSVHDSGIMVIPSNHYNEDLIITELLNVYSNNYLWTLGSILILFFLFLCTNFQRFYTTKFK